MYIFKRGFGFEKFIFQCVLQKICHGTEVWGLIMEGILIPGLPNDVSLEILARVPRQYYCQSMASVSSSWREAVISPALFALRKRLQVTESWLYTAVVCEHENRPSILWFAGSGRGSQWWPLPSMAEEHRPIYGFRCAAVGENLYVLGGCEWNYNNCSKFVATNKVSVFNARTNRWSYVEGMADARANFACGVVNGKLLVAGGDRFVDVDGENSDDDEREDFINGCKCLKSAETYNPLTNRWTNLADMIQAKHFVGGCVIDDKFVVRGFVCEGDMQFCEMTEIFEAAENRWVECTTDGVEEEMSESIISLFEMDDDDDDPSSSSSSTFTTAIKYYDDINVVKCNSQLARYGSNVLVHITNEEEIKGCECECGGIPQACFVMAI